VFFDVFPQSEQDSKKILPKYCLGAEILDLLTLLVHDCTCVMKNDACPEGFAFWYPASKEGFTTPTPKGMSASSIIFYESLAVLSALHDAHLVYPSHSKFVIYMDNFTMVSMFNSLRALPEYNCIIKTAIDILLEGSHDLRVLHIAGDDNGVADALSRSQFMHALSLQPGLKIQSFQPYLRFERRQLPPLLQPPRVTLGADLC